MNNDDRIVFLGSSTTDGFTYPMLIRQALIEAGRPVPLCINAGVGGDVVAGMRRRLERDVLIWAPSLVVLQCGENDAARKTSLEAFEAEADAIAATVRGRGIELIIQTPSLRGPGLLSDEALMEQYGSALRRVARRHGARVADVNSLLKAARSRGAALIEADNIHLNFEGCRIMSRGVLDAMGQDDVPVPAVLAVSPLPGLVRSWKIRALGDGRPLDAEGVRALKPNDGGWAELALPRVTPQEHWWRDQIRREGYALGLETAAGKAPRYVGMTAYQAATAGTAYFQAGAGLQTIWLNGDRIYQAPAEFRGYHAARDRVAAALRPGDNRMVIERGNEFVFCVTDSPEGVWRNP
jgi:lysophospholipase L1-like esterase